MASKPPVQCACYTFGYDSEGVLGLNAPCATPFHASHTLPCPPIDNFHSIHFIDQTRHWPFEQRPVRFAPSSFLAFISFLFISSKLISNSNTNDVNQLRTPSPIDLPFDVCAITCGLFHALALTGTLQITLFLNQRNNLTFLHSRNW